MDGPAPLALHATTVALEGQALVITGKSGSGKSSLGLQLMALGATLVADDTTLLHRDGTTLTATCAEPTRGVIEARGIGLLAARALLRAPVALAVSMDDAETMRLPPRRSVTWLGVDIPLILRVDAPHFAAALRQWMTTGRQR